LSITKDIEKVYKVTKMKKPNDMTYSISLENPKFRRKFIKRIERIVRNSMEYKDYIQFLKQNMDLDSCMFFQAVTSNKKANKSKITVEMHHEPFTLYEIVAVVLSRYEKEGLPLNDLLIADEVLELHYNNMVGLIPLSKTIHQMYHSENTDKVVIPLNMVYGEYSKFLEKYDEYIDTDLEYLYDKLDKKMEMTRNLTPESFENIMKQFEYLEVDGVEQAPKMEVETLKSA